MGHSERREESRPNGRKKSRIRPLRSREGEAGCFARDDKKETLADSKF